MKTGIELIAEERKRQIEVEGWTIDRDKKYTSDELAMAALSYTLPNRIRPMYGVSAWNDYDKMIPKYWPWKYEWWKPSPENRIRELQKAGALIAAEIDRLQALDNK